MTAESRNVEMVLVEDELDEKVAMGIGESSMRACALDEECEGVGVPAHVGDYLLMTYGDDEAGLREAVDVLRLSGLVDRGMPPEGKDVVCRVSGARKLDEDVYALSTPCPRLHRLGIEGNEVRAKGLLDGSWCHLVTSKHNLDDGLTVELFALDESTGEFSVGEVANYSIDSMWVVRGNPSSVGRLMDLRSILTTEEWASLILRSYGFDGEKLDAGERLCLLSRLAPLAQPGLQVLLVCRDGCLRACEASPYEGSAKYLQSEYEGFPGSWDCVVTGGEEGRGTYALSSLLDGYEGIATGVSLAVVSDGSSDRLRRATRLYGPFHIAVQTPFALSRKMGERKSHLGINRCLLGELWHALRKRNLSEGLSQVFDSIARQSMKEDEGVRLAFVGLAKVLHPTGAMTEEEGKKLLKFVLDKRP